MLKGRRKDFLKGSHHGQWAQGLPVRKFLNSRIGEPWSRVHSEASKEFDRRTYAGQQFWDQIRWEVSIHCWVGAKTGAIFEQTRYEEGRVVGFYVHPFSGILSYQKRMIGPRKPPEPPIEFLINNSMEKRFNKFEGLWYYVEYKWEFGMWFPKLKRQLGHKELKAKGLKNDPPEVCSMLREKALEKAKHANAEANL